MLTVSADKTAKMWDLTASPPTATQTFTFTNHAGEAAAQVGDMQVCTIVHHANKPFYNSAILFYFTGSSCSYYMLL